jgi:hypothetical protein
MLLCQTVPGILKAFWFRYAGGLSAMSRRRVEDGCQQLSQYANHLQSVPDLYNAKN